MPFDLVPLEIQPGLVTDETTFKVGQGAYVDVSNMRVHRGGMEVIGGWEQYAGGLVTGAARGIHVWRDNQQRINVAIGTNSGLYVIRGGAIYDITPTTGFTEGERDGIGGIGYGTGSYGTGSYGTPAQVVTNGALTWSLSNYGEALIANPRGQGIFMWSNDEDVPAALISNAPTQVTSAFVNSRNQIVAYGCNEESSGTFNSRCIRWCDIQDLTDWTSATDSNAGEFVFQGGGEIVTARPLLGGDWLIWTDKSCYSQTYLGSPSALWDFQLLGDACGVVGPNAVTVMEGQAYWLGPDLQFRTVGVGSVPQVITSPITDQIRADLVESQRLKVFAHSIAAYGEIWWHYPHREDGIENSRYVSFSAREGRWSAGKMARTCFSDAGVYEYPLAVNPDGKIFLHERGNSANGDPMEWHAETGDIRVSNSSRSLMLRSVRPDFNDQVKNVLMTVKSRLFPQSKEISYGPFTLSTDLEKYDLRVSGAVFRIRYEGVSNQASARIGSPVFDFVRRGRR